MAAPPPDPEDPDNVVEPDVLASRRIRRAEESPEPGYRERAAKAEQAVVSLERRLVEAEGRLADAQGERAALAARLAVSERALRTARQREFAEQQLRVDAEGEAGRLRREAEEQVVALRADLALAEERTEELATELERARREAVGAEPAASAEVTLLQRELDRRAAVHAAVGEQIAVLRTELERVRVQAEASTQRGGATEAVFAEAIATADRLRAAVLVLEAEKTHAELRLGEAQEAVSAKDAELAHTALELAAAREELGRHQTALTAAQEAAREGQATIADLQRRLEAERTEHALVRAEVAHAEATIRGELAAQRAAFEEQTRAVQSQVDSLRAQLTDAAEELHERLTTERDAAVAAREQVAAQLREAEDALAAARRAADESAAAVEDERRAAREQLGRLDASSAEEAAALRQAADEGLAREQARAAAAEQALQRAAADRDAARAELARRTALETQVHNALATLRQELRLDGGAAPAGQSLIADLLGTVAALRTGFDRELEALATERADEVRAAHERFAQELRSMEERVAEREGALAEHQEQVRRLEAELAELRGQDDDDDPQGAAGARVPLAARDVPRPDHPALATRAAHAGTPEELESVIVDLAHAAQRLRAQRGEGTVPAPPAGMHPGGEGPPAADPEPEPATPLPEALERATEAAARVLADAAETADVGDAAEGATSSEELPARRTAADVARTEPWLGAALTALAEREPATATRLLRDFLPVQAARVRKPVTYVLAVGDEAAVLATVQRGGVELRPAPEDRGEDEFRLSGSVTALAPLVAGGAPRRELPGAEVVGRKRRLRRLLRALSAPVSLAELDGAGVQPAPRDVALLLTAAANDVTTGAPPLTVGFAVDDEPPAFHVRVVDGARAQVHDGAAEDHDAVIRTPASAFLAGIAGTGPVVAEGDAQAARRVLGVLDAAQRLS